MNFYRQTIILFGIALPILVGALVVGACFFLRLKMERSFENKLSTFKTYQAGQQAGVDVEAEVYRQRPHMERWDKLLSQETASTVTTNLKEIAEDLPTKEFQLTAFERPSGSGGFGSNSAQSSSQVRIAFRGTFRTLERAFLELETRMPQLQLTDLKIDPSTTQSALLNLQVTYTAWEK